MITVTLNDADATRYPGYQEPWQLHIQRGQTAATLDWWNYTVNKPGTTAVTKNFTIGSGPVVITITLEPPVLKISLSNYGNSSVYYYDELIKI